MGVENAQPMFGGGAVRSEDGDMEMKRTSRLEERRAKGVDGREVDGREEQRDEMFEDMRGVLDVAQYGQGDVVLVVDEHRD